MCTGDWQVPYCTVSVRLMSGTGSVGSVLLDMVAFGDVYWRQAGAILHSVS